MKQKTPLSQLRQWVLENAENIHKDKLLKKINKLLPVEREAMEGMYMSGYRDIRAKPKKAFDEKFEQV